MILFEMLKPPNLFLGLLRAASWLFWRDPVSKSKTEQRQPRPPRRPTLALTNGPVPDEIFAVVRTSWFRQGRPVEVDEFQILECEDARTIFHYTVGQALRQGADVSIMTVYPPEALGIPRDNS